MDHPKFFTPQTIELIFENKPMEVQQVFITDPAHPIGLAFFPPTLDLESFQNVISAYPVPDLVLVLPNIFLASAVVDDFHITNRVSLIPMAFYVTKTISVVISPKTMEF
jgi:hypothetical protein